MYYIGPHACQEALERGALSTVFITSTVWRRYSLFRLLAVERGVTVYCKSVDILNQLCNNVSHQGICGKGADIPIISMDTLLLKIKQRGSKSLILMLDSIQDPNNFGAIIRSAAGANVDGIIFPKRRSAQINEAVIRASAGTIWNVPLIRVINLTQSMETLKENGAWIYGLAATGGQDYLLSNFNHPTVLVLGSEGFGLHKKICERCDYLLSINMPGKINSLNVSNAAAIMLFRVLAQRQVE